MPPEPAGPSTLASHQADQPGAPDMSRRADDLRAGGILPMSRTTLTRTFGPYLGAGGALVVLSAFLAVSQSGFATWQNVTDIFAAQSVLLTVAVGLTFVLLVGGFDLSVGAIMSLMGVLAAELVTHGAPAWLGIVVALVGGGVVGAAINGFLIARVGLSFLVVTLGSAALFGGVALVATGGQSVALYSSPFLLDLGSNGIAGIPIIVLVSLAVLALGAWILRYTGFGRQVYYVGGNQEAARVAGIPVIRVRMACYGIAGLTAGLAGVLSAARLSEASPTAGDPLALSAGAAVLLGGTTFYGGRGTLFGTLLGVLLLGVLDNGITLLQVSPYWQGIVSGIVIISAVLLDRLTGRSDVPG